MRVGWMMMDCLFFLSIPREKGGDFFWIYLTSFKLEAAASGHTLSLSSSLSLFLSLPLSLPLRETKKKQDDSLF